MAEPGQLSEPPIQRGEAVLFGDGRKGVVTRVYILEDKYAVKADGANREVKSPTGGFFYFKRRDLQRIVLVRPVEEGLVENYGDGEPNFKHARLELDTIASEVPPPPPPPDVPMGPPRYEGSVKWYSKEKGFGKIVPASSSGLPPTEEIFVHRKQMDGGPEGAHAQAISEGSLVTFELITSQVDGKPCACLVQVMGVRSVAPDSRLGLGQKEALVRKLLTSGMQIGSHQVKGVHKPTMEDRMIIKTAIPIETLGQSCQKVICSLFGVFDGHSGASCSEFVATNLDRSVFECLRHQNKREVNSDMAMRSALQAAFRTTEHNFFQYANRLEAGPATAWATAGSTACTATFFGPDEEGRLRLAIANAGDSRAVLGRKDVRAVRLSQDHTPEVPTERKRIEAEGSAVVNASGIWRIVLPSKKGTGFAGLSVSRGFGDLEYKQPVQVVSAVPDVFLRTVDLREESFVIIASDGIWGPVADGEAVRIVAARLREGGDDAARAAAQQLVEIAHQRDGHDDKTVLVIWFGDTPSEPPKVAAIPGPVVRMQPRHVVRTAAPPSSDDMFAEKLSLR